MKQTIAGEAGSLTVDGVALEVSERGQGKPLLFLHSGHPSGRLTADAPVLATLANSFRVIAPTHPGFGRAAAPDWMTTIDDLAYFYLDLLDAVDLRDVILVGASLGGWIAAEMAVKSTARVSRLVLANPVGIKIAGRETRDIVDIYAILDKQIAALAYADAKLGMPDKSTLSEDDLFYMARSREATARYAWSPFMHDPKLKGRLHRIGIPTLVLWGEADKIVSQEYGRAYAAAISGARFAPMPGAGHFPHLEKPEEFARAVSAFVEGKNPELVS
jgi:pimeloyl-ACP methyl ester carboxylesterase